MTNKSYVYLNIFGTLDLRCCRGEYTAVLKINNNDKDSKPIMPGWLRLHYALRYYYMVGDLLQHDVYERRQYYYL